MSLKRLATGKRVGNDLKAFIGEQAGDRVGRGAAVEDHRHARLNLVGDKLGDGEFLVGMTLIANGEIVLLGQHIRFDQGRAAVMSPNDAARLELVERATNRGKRTAKRVASVRRSAYLCSRMNRSIKSVRCLFVIGS